MISAIDLDLVFDRNIGKHENLNQIRGIKTFLASAAYSHVLVPFEQYGRPKKNLLTSFLCIFYRKTKLNNLQILTNKNVFERYMYQIFCNLDP